MSTSVWVDVGGTFTDCFVRDCNSRRAIKVLSSGIVRARLVGRINACSLRLDYFPGCETNRFWIGATIWLLDGVGGRSRLGEVISQQGMVLGYASDLASAMENRESTGVIELDAGIEAPVLATRLLLQTPLMEPLEPLEVRLGTTRGTNALLTRRGATTALVVTEGFGDLLRIGEQDRPDLFSLAIHKHPPLTDHVIEVTERLAASGNVLKRMDTDRLRFDLLHARQRGIQSLAICLLHSHVNDTHERQAEKLAAELGLVDVSRSSEVAPLIKVVSRAETTTLDAYLNPILSRYVEQVWKQFGGASTCSLRLMTSSGNLVAPHAFRGRDCILSGPAGGVVALGHVAQVAGVESVIGLDMGGTSTDVSRFDGHVGRRYESRVAGVRVMTPMMDIQTVAAGGGSICERTAEGRLTVGPQSAGADPGPACYGRGGPLTVTDLNLLLGRLVPSRFPFPLDQDAASRQLADLRNRLGPEERVDCDEALAEGFLDIAVTHMAEAVRTVSTAQGTDVRQMALAGFGGAAGQHLCRVANTLGIRRILDHPDAGMLSALGMGLADIGRVVSKGIYQLLQDSSADSINEVIKGLREEAKQQLKQEHADDRRIGYRFECDLRYQGTESPLTVPMQDPGTLSERFSQAHHHTFGYSHPERPVQLVVIRCEATISAEVQSEANPNRSARAVSPNAPRHDQGMVETTLLWHDHCWHETRVLDRHSLCEGQQIDAPAMIAGEHSTLVVEPGWQATVIAQGIISLSPAAVKADAVGIHRPGIEAAQGVDQDPVLLEVIARRLQGIADAMGEVLRRTAISVNVKERRDYSCAIFRNDGSLVANAPHVPVHLGAMGHTVRRIMSVFPSMSPGDCYLSNDPFSGGSHLPDVTAITPVFCSSQPQDRPDFFVASRAHHAEIGGITPGSMPPGASCLAEEGVLIRDFALTRSGVSNHDRLRDLLASGPYPSRCVEENLADIAAQQAAGAFGSRALCELARSYSTLLIDRIMQRMLDVSADAMQRWIQSLTPSPMTFEDALDDDTKISVELVRRSDQLNIEFATGPVHPNGFNATPSIVTAAVLYVLRCVCGSDLPLCDGVLRDVRLTIPRGLLDPPPHPDPRQCAAVVAGNVETSQRVVDVLLGALGVAAASQGTMNNLLFGNETFAYYETIGGGSGATPQYDGAHAVHTHMTNTRITDPEVLEARLPVRLHRFSIRHGSGGQGQHRGGDGIVREFEFLRPLVVSLITSRRTKPPYGMAGGQPGRCGENIWIKEGIPTRLPPSITFDVDAGQRLILLTPGGGGWGPSETSPPPPDMEAFSLSEGDPVLRNRGTTVE